MKVGDIVYCYIYDLEDEGYYIFGNNKVEEVNVDGTITISRHNRKCHIKEYEAFESYEECKEFLSYAYSKFLLEIAESTKKISDKYIVDCRLSNEMKAMCARLPLSIKFRLV